MAEARFTPLAELGDFIDRSPEEMTARAKAFFEEMSRRHSVREFSAEPAPRAAVENCIAAAARAPSGANHQPWHFALVGDPAVKRAIREAA